MWNLKHDANEPIRETEAKSRTQRTDRSPRRTWVGEGRHRSVGLADANWYIY